LPAPAASRVCSADLNKDIAAGLCKRRIDALEANYGGDLTIMPCVVNKEAFK
jgi:hypothetical protein